jgi:hypothetical protein
MVGLFRSVVAPLAIIVVLLVGWEFSKPRYPRIDESVAIAAPKADPPPPHNANEASFRSVRQNARKGALAGLDQPWAAMCRGDGRKRLVDALKYYFPMRRQQEASYPKRWGETGRDYIMREFATTDDRRIESLTADLYGRGYIDLRDFDMHMREYMEPVLKGVRVVAQPCPT